jgi:hypothetical protein
VHRERWLVFHLHRIRQFGPQSGPATGHYSSMSETPGLQPQPITPIQLPPPPPDRLYQAAAWVAVIAGVLQTVATIVFFVLAIWCLSTGRTPPWFREGGRRGNRHGGQ